MMYFLAMEVGGQKFIDLIQSIGFGRMVITKRITPYPGERWAFDNGAFGFYRRGLSFDMALYLKRLNMAASIAETVEPWFAVAPDIVAGGDTSLEFSNTWMNRQEADTFKHWYLAVQDGMQQREVERAITEYGYTGLFLGGSNEFKLRRGGEWREVCDSYGLAYHYARCGTRAKIRHAVALNCDSVDSALPIWRTTRLNDLLGYLEDARCIPPLINI